MSTRIENSRAVSIITCGDFETRLRQPYEESFDSWTVYATLNLKGAFLRMINKMGETKRRAFLHEEKKKAITAKHLEYVDDYRFYIHDYISELAEAAEKSTVSVLSPEEADDADRFTQIIGYVPEDRKRWNGFLHDLARQHPFTTTEGRINFPNDAALFIRALWAALRDTGITSTTWKRFKENIYAKGKPSSADTVPKRETQRFEAMKQEIALILEHNR